MTNKNEDPKQVPLLRLLKAQADLKHLTLQDDGDLSSVEWLRRVASLRTAIASTYLLASNKHSQDTIEWHALRDAAFMHETDAAANLNAVAYHDKTTKDGAA